MRQRKSVLCLLGFHRDEHKRSADAGPYAFYFECRRCGRFHDGPGAGAKWGVGSADIGF